MLLLEDHCNRFEIYDADMPQQKFIIDKAVGWVDTLPKKTQRKIRESVYSTIGSDMLVAEHMQETFKRIVADDVREDAKKISQPTLLIYGQNDVSTPVNIGMALQAVIPNSKIEIIPEVGHMLPTDATSAVLGMVTEFIK